MPQHLQLPNTDSTTKTGATSEGFLRPPVGPPSAPAHPASRQVDRSQGGIQMRQGAVFFALVNQSMLPLLGVVHTFPAEAAIVRREQANGLYSVGPYFLAKTLSDLPWQTTAPALFGIIFYWMVGLNPGAAQFFTFLGIFVLVCPDPALCRTRACVCVCAWAHA